MNLNEGKIHSRIEYEGMKISIEVPAGGKRTGVNRKGERWENPVFANYGYILGTHSPDGELLDCYVRKNPKKAARVYVMHQLSVGGDKFDEDKVMLGYSSAEEAIEDFKRHTFKPAQMYGGYSEFDLEHFKVIAYSASNSTAMLASQKMFDKFSAKGLLPRGIKSPIQVAQIVKESFAMTQPLVEAFTPHNPLIDYSTQHSMIGTKEAMTVCREYKIDAEAQGSVIMFRDENELERFIDVVDEQRLPKELLGDLQAALPESLDTIVEDTLGVAVDDLHAEMANGRDPYEAGEEIAHFYGLNAAEVTREALITWGAYQDSKDPQMDPTDEAVHFQNGIMEMRRNAGITDSADFTRRNPAIHDLRALIESKDRVFRNVIKRNYINHAMLRGQL